MQKTCRAACRLCVAAASSWQTTLPRAATLCAGGALLALAALRLLAHMLSPAARRRLVVLLLLLLRPAHALIGLLLRSPLGPTLRAALRLLQRLLRLLSPLSRHAATAGAVCANFCRRRLITLLGGSVGGSAKGL